MMSLKWRWASLLSFLCAVVPVWADVPPAYPPQNTPTIQSLSAAGHGQVVRNVGLGGSTVYNPSTGILTFTPNNHFGTVKPSAGGLVGTKTNPVNLYDNYGNIARGQIQTQTQLPQTSTIAKAGAALYGAQVFGSAVKHQSSNVGQAIANGDYKGATQYAVEGLLQGLREAGDAVLFGGISGVEQGYQAFKQAQESKAQQAFNKSEQDSQHLLNQYDPSLKNVNVWYLENTHTKQRQVFLITGKTFLCCRGVKDSPNADTTYLFNDAGERYNVPPYNYRETSIRSDWVPNTKELYERRPTVEEVMLSQTEIEAIMVQQLQQLLNDTNRNHTELINALWAAGLIGSGNTQSMVTGNAGDNTFLTQPFTPAGSDQAQQTQFVIHNNGTITQNTVQRPDLVANSSQAPTRAEVGNQHQQGQQDTRPAKTDSTAEKPDVCAQNPNSLMCAPVGSADYTDPVIPTRQIDMAFTPANIFTTDGVCPAPRPVQFQLGAASVNWEFSYSTVCDFSRYIRPIVIMCGMFMAAAICYGAVKRL